MKISKSKEIRSAALDYKARFLGLDVNSLDIDAYNQKYIEEYGSKIDYNLYLADFLLSCAGSLDAYDTLIDFGGGIGFNSGFYASLGLDLKIIYVDIDPASKETAEIIHQALGINGLEYITGGIEEIGHMLTDKTLICSRDVIEHVYDLESFFTISQQAKKNVHNTAAILDSVFRASEFEEIHYRAEHLGASSTLKKSRDSVLPYSKQRKDMILGMDPSLNASEIDTIAQQTRGLIDVDIQRFMTSGAYPKYHQESLYDNCCDPRTGNWAERTLGQEDYIRYADNKVVKFAYPKYNALNAKGKKKLAIQALNIFAQLPIHSIQPSFSIVY